MFGQRLCLLLLGVLAIALGACSTTAPVQNRSAGEVCSSNTDCATGSCLGLAVFPPDGGACTIAGMSCTTTCNDDTDCTKLGPNFKCFNGCPGGQKTCGAT